MDIQGNGFGVFVTVGGGKPPKQKKVKQPKNDFLAGFPNFVPAQPQRIPDTFSKKAPEQTPASSYGSSPDSAGVLTPPPSPKGKQMGFAGGHAPKIKDVKEEQPKPVKK